MKKVFGLFLSATIIATMFISCGGNSASVKTQTDSINYAFGIANANGIRQYVLMADTADINKVNQFCEGLQDGLKKQTTKERLTIEGFRLGVSMKEEIANGFLLNDTTLPAKHELIVSTFQQALKGEKCCMTPEEGQQYFQTVLGHALNTGEPANITPEQVDTINMLIGLLNAEGARKYILAKDTTSKDINIFVEGFENGLNSNDDNSLYMKGIEIGKNMYRQMSTTTYLFNDSTIEQKIELIQRGLIDGLKESDSAIFTSEQAIEYINIIMEAKSKARNAKAIEKKAKNIVILANA